MRHHRIVSLLVGAGLLSLLVFSPTAAERRDKGPGFDPLFAKGASCAPAQAGRPVLLATLLQAQSRQPVPPTETRPFQPGQQLPSAADSAAPPLYKDLGKLHIPISTRSAQAQAYFDQGVRLMFAFNHAEAARAFRAAQQFDPGCAMCYWGEALVLGPNINAPMFPEAFGPAYQASRKAASLADKVTPHEQAVILAVTQRYSASPAEDRKPLDQALRRPDGRHGAPLPDP